MLRRVLKSLIKSQRVEAFFYWKQAEKLLKSGVLGAERAENGRKWAENGTKMAENGGFERKLTENGAKMSENGAKMAENEDFEQKMAENGSKMAENGTEYDNDTKMTENDTKMAENDTKMAENDTKMVKIHPEIANLAILYRKTEKLVGILGPPRNFRPKTVEKCAFFHFFTAFFHNFFTFFHNFSFFLTKFQNFSFLL
jgi:hypothetical protein